MIRPVQMRSGGFACARPRLPGFDAAPPASYVWRMTDQTFPARRTAFAALRATLCAAVLLPSAALAQTMPKPAPLPPDFEIPGAPPAPHRAPDQAPQQKRAPEPKAPPQAAIPADREKLLEELYARLAGATDAATAAEVANAVEQLWQHSGSATADLLVARASAAIEDNRRDLAMQLLNAAVELQPDFAEAWNRRAYLFFLDEDYKRALGDLRRVLALEPHHFKALEGLAGILQRLGEKKAALEAYESLLRVHPQVPGGKEARDELKVEVEGQGI